MASKSDIATAPIPRDVIRRRVLPADALAHTRPDLPVYDLAAIPARELAPKKNAVTTVSEPRRGFFARRRADPDLGMFAERLARLN